MPLGNPEGYDEIDEDAFGPIDEPESMDMDVDMESGNEKREMAMRAEEGNLLDSL